MLSTFGEELVQVTELVKSCVLPSVRVPIALSCIVLPRGMLSLLADMAIATSVAGDVLKFALPVMFEDVAETAVVPTDLARTEPPLLTEITFGAELAHVTDPVMSFVVLSV